MTRRIRSCGLVVALAALVPSILIAQSPRDEVVIDTDFVVSRVAFSRDSQTVAGIGTGSLGLWDVASRALSQTVSWERDNRAHIAISSPVDWVAAVESETALKLWNLTEDGLPERLETTTPDARASSQFSRTARSWLTPTRTRARVRVWEIPSGRLRFVTADTGIGPTSPLAFAPDGSLLAGANGDTDLYVWSGHDGTLLRVIDELLLTTFAVTFSPDGHQMITAGVDRAIYVWDTGHVDGATVRAPAPGGGPNPGAVSRWTGAGHGWPGYDGQRQPRAPDRLGFLVGRGADPTTSASNRDVGDVLAGWAVARRGHRRGPDARVAGPTPSRVIELSKRTGSRRR